MTKLLASGVMLVFLHPANAADLPEDPGAEPGSTPVAEEQAPAGMKTLAACRRAILDWAEPYGPVDVQTVIVGPVERQFNGTKVAPLFVRIAYETSAGRETRKAKVRCTLNGDDAVAVEPTE